MQIFLDGNGIFSRGAARNNDSKRQKLQLRMKAIFHLDGHPWCKTYIHVHVMWVRPFINNILNGKLIPHSPSCNIGAETFDWYYYLTYVIYPSRKILGLYYLHLRTWRPTFWGFKRGSGKQWIWVLGFWVIGLEFKILPAFFGWTKTACLPILMVGIFVREWCITNINMIWELRGSLVWDGWGCLVLTE